MTSEDKKPMYIGIQMLRFIAALLVVIDHAILQVVDNWRIIPEIRNYAALLGHSGVVVFFGISGFIMVNTRYNHFGNFKNSIEFIFSRVIRILPIYIIATTLRFLIKFHLGGDYNITNFLKSILFIPYISTENGLYRPILGQGWTLNYEIFFYIIFAFSLYFSRKKGLILSIIIFLIFSIFENDFIKNNMLLNFYFNNILLYFVCGMLTAILMKHYKLNINNLSYSITSIILLIVANTLLKEFFIDYLCLLLSLVFTFSCVYFSACYRDNGSIIRIKFNLLIVRLGDASYSTYLFHGFFLGSLKIISTRISDGHYEILLLFIILSVVGANFIGLLSHKYIELPVTNFMSKKYKNWR